MALPQLRLVTEAPPDFNHESADPTRRIFEHWLFMFGRSPRRCKMGPTRRAAINAALAMGYDEETLLLAIDGMASDALDGARDDRMRDAMREIEWLLAREARIERWAGIGDALRERASQPDRPNPESTRAEPPPDPAAAAAARERLKALAQRMRAGGLR